MKKLILPAAIALSVITGCRPLSLAMNTENNGNHVLLTSDISLFTYSGNPMDIAMGVKITPKDTLLGIVLTTDCGADHGVFDRDDRIMIRFADSSEITLLNVYDKECSTETKTNVTEDYYAQRGLAYAYSPWCDVPYLTPYVAYSMVPTVYTTQTTVSYALYLITFEQLIKMRNTDIIKLRVELEDRDLDMPQPERARDVFVKLSDFLYESVTEKAFQRSKF